MLIQGENLHLRSSGTDDAGLEELIGSFSDLKYLSETRLYDEHMPDKIIFRIEQGAELVGELLLKSIRWYNRKAEISILIRKDMRRSGLARQALQLAMDYAFNTLNLHRLEAEVFSYNGPALALFKSLGFVQEGILREARFMDGGYHDIIRFGLLRREYNRKPSA